jgi:hypothetical protein
MQFLTMSLLAIFNVLLKFANYWRRANRLLHSITLQIDGASEPKDNYNAPNIEG